MLINARNRSVAIDGDRIVDEGGRCDLVIDCPELEIRPGLINAHDHLHRNHYGRLGRPTYANAYCWADDIQVRYRRRIASRRRLPRRAALLAGAWKNLFAGVTTVVHHDPWEGDFDRGFPIRVARVACADSPGKSTGLSAPAGEPFCVHVAEGTDDVAAGEVDALDRAGLLNQRLVGVHGVGMDGDSIARFRKAEAALVWCPTSNAFLFARSAPDALFDGATDILIGSDSRLTGEGDLLDDLRAARRTGLVDDQRLADAVGETSARRLALPRPSLEPGSTADLILLERPLGRARASDVALTVVGGVPRVASREVARWLGPIAERGAEMRIGPVVRWTDARTDHGTERRPNR